MQNRKQRTNADIEERKRIILETNKTAWNDQMPPAYYQYKTAKRKKTNELRKS